MQRYLYQFTCVRELQCVDSKELGSYPLSSGRVSGCIRATVSRIGSTQPSME